jgi:hypothetical protein
MNVMVQTVPPMFSSCPSYPPAMFSFSFSSHPADSPPLSISCLCVTLFLWFFPDQNIKMRSSKEASAAASFGEDLPKETARHETPTWRSPWKLPWKLPCGLSPNSTRRLGPPSPTPAHNVAAHTRCSRAWTHQTPSRALSCHGDPTRAPASSIEAPVAACTPRLPTPPSPSPLLLQLQSALAWNSAFKAA